MNSSLLFIILAISGGIGYGLNSLLIAKFARKMDGLTLTVCRSMSLVITMSPVLLWATKDKFMELTAALPTILPASLFGAISVWLYMLSFRHIPVAFSSAIRNTSAAILLPLAILFLDEPLRGPEIFWIALILGGIMTLLLQKIPPNFSAASSRPALGFLQTGLGTLTLAASLFFLSIGVRTADPFLTAYTWEAMIGILIAPVLLLRQAARKSPIYLIPAKQFLLILLAASPTAIGSICIPFAFSIGNPGIAQAIVSAMAVLTVSIGSLMVHRERLNIAAWLAIVAMITGIAALHVI